MTLKRCIQWLSLAVGLALPLAPASAASDLLFGQQHAYSVTLRGNGEAVVTARLVITNRTAAPLSKFTFTIPKLTVSEIAGYQQTITPTPCVTTTKYPTPVEPCVQVEPDYATSPYYYSTSQSTYDKLSFSATGQQYEVTLPKPVAADKQTALLVSYAGKGYVTNQLGRWNYAVPTIEVSERVSTATIAISVDSDLYLDGGSSNVNYAGKTTAAELQTTDAAGAQPSSASLNRIAAAVGADGQMSKTARNLAAGDSYTVKGTYADAVWKLYYGRLAIAAGIILLVVALLAWWWLRHRSTPSMAQATTAASGPAAKIGKADSGKLAVIIPLVGLASAIVTTLIVYGSAWLSLKYASYATDPYLIVGISAFLVTVALCLLAVIGPIAWVSLTYHSWRAGLAVFVSQVAWLIGILLLVALVLAPILGSSPSPVPILQDSSAVRDSATVTTEPGSAPSSGSGSSSSGTATK